MFWITRIILLSLMGFGLPSPAAHAGTREATVSNISLERVGGKFFLSADLHFGLSDTAREALGNGVPLFWNVFVKILRPRAVLAYETLFDTSLRYRLEYHALLNVYRVVFEHNEQAYNVPSLSAALELMSSLRALEVMLEHAAVGDQRLLVAIKLDFDRSSLPMPLRPFAYFNCEWDLSSPWVQWPWKK